MDAEEIMNALREVRAEVTRVHERLDTYEETFGKVLIAAKQNPALAAMLKMNGVSV